MLDNNIKY